METQWRIELLCGLRAVGADRVLSRFQTQKIGLLLAYLAYYPQRPHQREALIELLWPECDSHAGRNNLSVSLSWLRRQLEPRPIGGECAGTREAGGVDGPAQTGSPSPSTISPEPLTVI